MNKGGTISIFPVNINSQASDKFTVFQDIEEEIYTPISLYTGKEYTFLKNNALEQNIEDWVSSVELKAGSCQSVLEYGIANTTISYPFIEFDITAKTNITSLALKDLKIIMEYASNLGSNVVMNNKIEVLKKELIEHDDYGLEKNDLSEQKFVLNIKKNHDFHFMEVRKYPKALCRVKIEVSRSNRSPGLIYFDNNSMKDQSFYESDILGQEDFDCVLTPDDVLYNFADFTFYPDTLNAGVRDTLYITGTGFGSIPGEVLMRNAEETNPQAQSYFFPITPAKVIWTPTLIKAEIVGLSKNGPFASTPASGNIMLMLPDSTIINNSDSAEIEVFYSISNYDNERARVNLLDQNGMGGYTFHLGTNLSNTPGVRTVIEKNLEDWHQKTCVNFTLSTVTINNPVELKDSLNVIFFDSIVTSNLMEVFVHTDAKVPMSGAVQAWATDIDIVVNNGWRNPWYISLDTIQNNTEFDFYSAMLHEFGHAHQLNHVLGEQSIGVDKTMYGRRSKGFESRDIGPAASEGGLDVMNFNAIGMTGLPSPPFNVSPMRDIPWCVLSTYEIESNNSISIFPNPSNKSITVEFELLGKSDVSVYITDILGRETLHHNLGEKLRGVNSSLINIQSLSQGIYFLTVKTGKVLSTRKFIKE